MILALMWSVANADGTAADSIATEPPYGFDHNQLYASVDIEVSTFPCRFVHCASLVSPTANIHRCQHMRSLLSQWGSGHGAALQVSHSSGRDLSARLPWGWLPMGEGTASLEASMRQRGYEVQMIPLHSTPSMIAAQYIFETLPTPNRTAFQLVLNVRCQSLRSPRCNLCMHERV